MRSEPTRGVDDRRRTKSGRLIDQSTPENAIIVSVPFSEHEEQRQRHRDERAHVVGDALVGVGEPPRRAAAEVHAVGR